MANCKDNKNPLIHNGTSQAQRVLPGLDRKSFALVDEKQYADWIVFADAFAAFINYYSTANTVAGDWQPFFSSDISAQLGTIAIQHIDAYREQVKERFDFIRDDANKLLLTDIKVKLNELFSALLTLSKSLDDYYLKLPTETTLKNGILNSIKTKLSPAIARLMAYQKGAENLGYLIHTPLSDWKILNRPLTDSGLIMNTIGLSDAWFDKTVFADWNVYEVSITEDRSIYNNPLSGFGDVFLSIEHAANHNLFTGIFDTFLTAYTKIIQDANAELARTLESFNAHTPHYALFLVFLKLYRYARDHINEITQRHLDFYYKKVLRLLPKPAVDNQVHVLGELAKQVHDHLLPQGTPLKAGKDSLNKDVTYTLDRDAVFTTAKVSQLKTFFKAAATEDIYSTGTTTLEINNTGRVFASPITNSDDGNGAKLTSANKEWQPYVHKVFEEAELETIAMPKAKMGFAIASHYLYLTEGERKVFVRLAISSLNALDGKQIECYLTTEKGWYAVDSPVISSTGTKMSDGITSCTEISFTIPGSVKAITNYNSAVHGGSLSVALPVFKLILVNDDAKPYEYDLLKDLTLTKVEIRTEVGMSDVYNQKGLKNLLLSNDFGVVDASKPFQAFGQFPVPGNRLVIGNKELFSKSNCSIKLNIEWKGVPDSAADVSFVVLGDGGNFPNISINVLEAGIWNMLEGYEELFDYLGAGVNPNRQISIIANGTNGSVTDYAQDYGVYDIASNKGFIALQLTQSFGYKEYLATLTDYLILKANSNTTDDIGKPVEPYIPTIQSLYVGYAAFCIHDLSDAAETNFENREIQFFHLYPFGDGEQHKYLSPSDNIYLLPQFKHSEGGGTLQHIGEFYIGIENINPGEAVSILFQLMEGTSNPLVAKPEEHIYWAYLSNNRWVEFDKDVYSDNTLALVQSGIISFPIPEDASLQNTILPLGYIWLRAAVKEAAEAVCKLITVDAQATVARFADNGNADNFLDQALPAGVISKLRVPDSAIKKINQPYPSFGGRPKENDDHFYIRVSERLRHKDRAIMVWDYEHLVLEAFPEIYKVKCLNHTQIEPGIYNEVKPGYVSIITIPSLQNRNDADPLKPFTQQSTLTNIEIFLRKRISCFVNLHACQPQFEEIRMEFSMKLYAQYPDFNFYSNKLKAEITQFLSPWAFSGKSTIDFGGIVYKSVIINFIEERYYVDFITDVFMYVKVDDLTPESNDMDEISASTARSILVSASASKHVIHEIVPVNPNAMLECPDGPLTMAENA